MELFWFDNATVSGISEKVNGSPEKTPPFPKVRDDELKYWKLVIFSTEVPTFAFLQVSCKLS